MQLSWGYWASLCTPEPGTKGIHFQPRSPSHKWDLEERPEVAGRVAARGVGTGTKGRVGLEPVCTA